MRAALFQRYLISLGMVRSPLVPNNLACRTQFLPNEPNPAFEQAPLSTALS
jgi:hypothetical protein